MYLSLKKQFLKYMWFQRHEKAKKIQRVVRIWMNKKKEISHLEKKRRKNQASQLIISHGLKNLLINIKTSLLRLQLHAFSKRCAEKKIRNFVKLCLKKGKAEHQRNLFLSFIERKMTSAFMNKKEESIRLLSLLMRRVREETLYA